MIPQSLITIKNKDIRDTMDTIFTLETKMGKPTSNGAQSILKMSWYNDFLALSPSSSPRPKDPLRINKHEEIGRDEVIGMPTC